MITGSAAGHDFVDGACQCGRLFVDIANVTQDDVGKTDIAHKGTLMSYEVDQIRVLRERMETAVNRAFGWR